MGDEKIELAVVVIIEPERTRRKSAVLDPCRFRDVAEFAAAYVSEQAIAAKRGEIDIDATVVIEVSRGAADAVDLDVQSGSAGEIGERAIVIVAVQRGVRLCGF